MLEIRALARTQTQEAAQLVAERLSFAVGGVDVASSYVWIHDPEKPKFADASAVKGWSVSVPFETHGEAAAFYASLDAAVVGDAELIPPKPRLRRAA